jgi:hypothetical protein
VEEEEETVFTVFCNRKDEKIRLLSSIKMN